MCGNDGLLFLFVCLSDDQLCDKLIS